MKQVVFEIFSIVFDNSNQLMVLNFLSIGFENVWDPIV